MVFNPGKGFQIDGVPADFPKPELMEQAQAKILYADEPVPQVWALDSVEIGVFVLFEAESRNALKKMISSFPLSQVKYANYNLFLLVPHQLPQKHFNR